MITLSNTVRLATSGDEGGMLLDIRDSRCLHLNRSASHILGEISIGLSESEISAAIATATGAPLELVRDDVQAFIAKAFERGWLTDDIPVPKDNVHVAKRLMSFLRRKSAHTSVNA